jgi:hypothetical protein
MCCGRQRQAWNERPASPAPPTRPVGSVPAPGHARTLRDVAQFEYVGDTALTVMGPVSGTRYRFAQRGAVVAVDLRDRRAVAAVPHLREVKR